MKGYSKTSVIVIIMSFLGVMVLGLSCTLAQNTSTRETVSSEGGSRHVDIWSDGTRLSGDIWYPPGLKSGEKAPAIIMCHGWGGLRSHLNSAYAPMFAKAGYVVLTFDYRGWADSDSRLVIKGKMPEPDTDGMVTVRAQAIRELVDPFDQTEDIINCINFIVGEPGVDPKRIGLWGTSFGGGHVVYVAAHDKRVKCIVSQVPSMSGSWVYKYFKPTKMAIKRARGEIEPVPQGVNKIPNLNGTPFLDRIANYLPVKFAKNLRIPVLIIVAEGEELMKNSEHGQKVYNIVKRRVPAKYEVFEGSHFQIYGYGRKNSIKSAINWFNRHLRE